MAANQQFTREYDVTLMRAFARDMNEAISKLNIAVGTPLTAADVTTALGYTPVNKAGDTMSGTLTAPNVRVIQNGSVESQFVLGNQSLYTFYFAVPITRTALSLNWCDAAGAYAGTAMSVARSDGSFTFNTPVTLNSTLSVSGGIDFNAILRMKSGAQIRFDAEDGSDKWRIGQHGYSSNDSFFIWDNVRGVNTFNISPTDGAVLLSGSLTVGSSIISYGTAQSYQSDPAGYSALVLGNAGANSGWIFKNGTTRSADGGPNTMTLRNDAGALRLMSNAGNITIDTAGSVTASAGLIGQEVYSNGWFRSNGNQGWYSGTYNGGIYMTDAEYVRTYNGKGFYSDVATSGRYAGVFRADDNRAFGKVLQVGTSNGTGTDGPQMHFIHDSVAEWGFGLEDNNGIHLATYWGGSSTTFGTKRHVFESTGGITMRGDSSVTLTMADLDETIRYLHTNSSSIGFLTSGFAWAFRSDNAGNAQAYGHEMIVGNAQSGEKRIRMANAGRNLYLYLSDDGTTGLYDVTGTYARYYFTPAGQMVITNIAAQPNVNTGSWGGNLQIHNGGTGGACKIAFHRPGAYALEAGLDTDNVFRIGGGSDGANYRVQFDGSGNMATRGGINVGGGTLIPKITVSSSAPGTLATNELYFQT